MASEACLAAIFAAQASGKALLKFISPNDAGATSSHQSGFYLPKDVRADFTPCPPTRGVNSKHEVEVDWFGANKTKSVVTWYGKSKDEYRLTRFGPDFCFRDPSLVGGLLLLVPIGPDTIRAFVLTTDEDIEEIQAALGLEIIGSWARYSGEHGPIESPEECVEKLLAPYVGSLTFFPSTKELAERAAETALKCRDPKNIMSSDQRLMLFIGGEYELFKRVETRLCSAQAKGPFKDMDEFLRTANTILQRRKARAGKSLEHHVARILEGAGVPFTAGSVVEGTRPDILIPGRKEYSNPRWPDGKLFALGLKTTCRDRWRQVVSEAPRVKHKHLLTLQHGVSDAQIALMENQGVTLVVPNELHREFPPYARSKILTVSAFIELVAGALQS